MTYASVALTIPCIRKSHKKCPLNAKHGMHKYKCRRVTIAIKNYRRQQNKHPESLVTEMRSRKQIQCNLQSVVK